MNAEDYTYSFRAQVQTAKLGRYEDIEFVITTEVEITELQARNIFAVIHSTLFIHRVIEFRRLPQ